MQVHAPLTRCGVCVGQVRQWLAVPLLQVVQLEWHVPQLLLEAA